MKKPRLVILGTGTCQLEPNRMASSVLVQLPEAQFVFDMGRGISLRLVEVGLRQDDIEHVVLSHFHADHIGDGVDRRILAHGQCQVSLSDIGNACNLLCRIERKVLLKVG